jgi:ATP-binding cassette subfamily B protein
MSDIQVDQQERENGRKALSNGAVFGFIAARWMRRPWRLALITTLMLGGTLCDLGIPWAAGALVEAVSNPLHGATTAWRAWAMLTALYMGMYMLRNRAFLAMNRFSARNMEEMVNASFQRVQSFSSDWFANTFAGSTVRKITRGMWGYDAVSDSVFLLLGPSLLVLAGLAVSIGVRWPLAGLFCGAVVASFMLFNLLMAARYIRPANLKSNAYDSQLGATLADAIGGNAVVKSFGAEAREEARNAEVTAAWRAAVITTWNRFNTVNLGQNVMLLLLQSGLTGLLVWSWAKGRASAGDVAFAITSFMLMSGYMRNFAETTRNLQKGLDDTLDLAVYMRTPAQVADRPDARPMRQPAGPAQDRRRRGEIVFDRVTFRYANQPAPLYSNFSLRIAPGERIALVGPTGGGKSTFVKLIQRLYDLEAGAIVIDGEDIADLTQASLRQAIAVVPQDPALFHRTISENIAYGRPDATPEEIIAVARRARAHDFIARLPKGYDTLVGERGVKLSGGERQRVAIARAMLTDAPILVLDEATSSLDMETEKMVQAAADALMAGRTTVVIAHRLSTIRDADRILVFQEGRIVEEGRHGDLVLQGGVYSRLSALATA